MSTPIRKANEIITRLRASVIAKNEERINRILAQAEKLPWTHLDHEIIAEFDKAFDEAQTFLNTN